MKPTITVNMNLSTRPAIYTVPVNRPELGLAKGDKCNVDVFGIYQVQMGEDEIDAYFVITLPDGRCTYAGVTSIQFTDMGVHDESTYSN